MQNINLFKPPRHLRNAHIQTVLNSQGPRKLRAKRILQRLSTQLLELRAEDGTLLLAELDLAVAPRAALVVLLHGWEGSSRSSYLVTTAARLLAQGYDVLRVNLRDHGESHHLNRELFNSTRTPEVASALQGFVDTHNYERIFLVGYSLGASFALRIAAFKGQTGTVRTLIDEGADVNAKSSIGSTAKRVNRRGSTTTNGRSVTQSCGTTGASCIRALRST